MWVLVLYDVCLHGCSDAISGSMLRALCAVLLDTLCGAMTHLLASCSGT
jgi:hypothetical protein